MFGPVHLSILRKPCAVSRHSPISAIHGDRDHVQARAFLFTQNNEFFLRPHHCRRCSKLQFQFENVSLAMKYCAPEFNTHGKLFV